MTKRTAEKHTPAPWSADPATEGDDAVVEALTADRRYVVREICHVLIDESDPSDWPTTRANLRLIAAAPELLAALEAMRQHDSAGGPCDKPGFKCDCYARADAAIAKAKGAP